MLPQQEEQRNQSFLTVWRVYEPTARAFTPFDPVSDAWGLSYECLDIGHSSWLRGHWSSRSDSQCFEQCLPTRV